MGMLAVGVLLVGVALSFHETLWPWAILALIVWGSLSAIEKQSRPDKWN